MTEEARWGLGGSPVDLDSDSRSSVMCLDDVPLSDPLSLSDSSTVVPFGAITSSKLSAPPDENAVTVVAYTRSPATPTNE